MMPEFNSITATCTNGHIDTIIEILILFLVNDMHAYVIITILCMYELFGSIVLVKN